MVISIKYGWNTITWAKVMHLGHFVQTYDVSKSIPAAKFQNFVGKKSTWVKLLEFDFFYLKRQGYIDITRANINLMSHHLHTQILR